MDTNINSIDSQYTYDTIVYDDGQIDGVIQQLNQIIDCLNQISSEIVGLEAQDSSWSGKSKAAYVDLKEFLKSYRKDYQHSIKELKSTISGLETLLNSIPSATVLKEIDGA
ncbi:hypothetical protein JNE33_07120 [Streptococcus suis]|uniref:hypothetical protein n=1 Tax=Streptococcus suis TaxID=1307 RepID=UPI00192E12F6|nr:hypothetical protein [Streptococcus suis]MBL6440273.1 hypothetical protein [Streptococcus suis]HEM6145370.1 hypothetical protein [Streptococcus suis]HEM6362978.1 hypothetical protein [Streptococcus suis]HEM6402917.1 hypothetical protein [Streptococcus suis]